MDAMTRWGLGWAWLMMEDRGFPLCPVVRYFRGLMMSCKRSLEPLAAVTAQARVGAQNRFWILWGGRLVPTSGH